MMGKSELVFQPDDIIDLNIGIMMIALSIFRICGAVILLFKV